MLWQKSREEHHQHMQLCWTETEENEALINQDTESTEAPNPSEHTFSVPGKWNRIPLDYSTKTKTRVRETTVERAIQKEAFFPELTIGRSRIPGACFGVFSSLGVIQQGCLLTEYGGELTTNQSMCELPESDRSHAMCLTNHLGYCINGKP